MVENGGQGSLNNEGQTGTKVGLGEHPHSAHIQNDSTCQWESDELNENEGGHLQKFSSLVSLHDHLDNAPSTQATVDERHF